MDKIIDHHEGTTIHDSPRKGRRGGDVSDADLSRREIDKHHLRNGIFFLSELTLMRKAVEAILSRDIAAMQVAAEKLKKGG